MSAFFYMSFVKDGKFAGVVIAEGSQLVEALTNATLRGLNPGGEVAGWPIPAHIQPKLEAVNVLLSIADLTRLHPEWGCVRHGDSLDKRLDDYTEQIHEHCNEDLKRRKVN